MTIERKELFSEKVPAGSRTYFFDVKKWLFVKLCEKRAVFNKWLVKALFKLVGNVLRPLQPRFVVGSWQ
ncbi:MAG: DUF3276 family protein, partial [Chloroflexota bacterium]|nr:DUF3276 family protein [Chloroflexota bacterium]